MYHCPVQDMLASLEDSTERPEIPFGQIHLIYHYHQIYQNSQVYENQQMHQNHQFY